MGYPGYLTLVNGSPFDWTVGYQHSYQMDRWNWPTVAAGTAAKVPVEFGTRGHQSDDAGEAFYKIANTQETFQVLARKPSDFKLTISLDNLATKSSPKGSIIDLGFRKDAAVNYVLTTDDSGTFWSSSGTATVDWMQQGLGTLGNRTLRQICMPGSHDAGMSVFRPGTVGAHFANTQTQYLDFYGQLVAGSRYFDLRPVISNGQWVAGHYSKLGDGDNGVWVGGNGQSIEDIVSQVNRFTSQYKELVIINLSHTLDTDHDYKDLTQTQWNDLFDTFKGLNNRLTNQNPARIDFSQRRLNEFIQDRAVVFLRSELPAGITLGNYANDGFFTAENWPVFDSYSNSNDGVAMMDDQLRKLKENRNLVADSTSRKDTFHVLSWTLTQQAEDVLNFDRAIMNLAASVYDPLFERAYNAFTPQSFPNVLFVDALGVRDKTVVFPFEKPKSVSVSAEIGSLAVAVNFGKAGRNKYISGR